VAIIIVLFFNIYPAKPFFSSELRYIPIKAATKKIARYRITNSKLILFGLVNSENG